jgi:hypothetical protein
MPVEASSKVPSDMANELPTNPMRSECTTKAQPTPRRLELEFHSSNWRVRINVKSKGPVSVLRGMSVLGSFLNLKSAGMPLRAIGWRTPCSRRRARFARFLANPVPEVSPGGW